jgi:hypothetical protein
VRILFLTQHFSVLSETFVYDRALALRQRGHDVHVATFERRMAQERPFDQVHVLNKTPCGTWRACSTTGWRG